MPNHEFVKVLRARAIELQEELDSIFKLVSRYDDSPPPAASVKPGKMKSSPAANGKVNTRLQITPADKNTLRVLITKGRDNDQIMAELGGRIKMHHIYGMRSSMKKEAAAS